MRNLIIFLSTFTLTVLLGVFMATPANAGGSGGSWGDDGTPVIYPPNPNCPTSTNPYTGGCGAGGGTGGGSGGSWSPPQLCKAGEDTGSSLAEVCSNRVARVGGRLLSWNNSTLKCDYINGSGTRNTDTLNIAHCRKDPNYKPTVCPSGYENINDVCVKIPPPPDFPDLPPPTPDCNVCANLYQIQMKLNTLKNYDIKIINQDILDMSQTINNIDNSITSLNVEMNTVNNNITNINNTLGDIITNIENNNITNNEIKNEVNNIKNVMNDYSLQLGDIKMAMGDIDVKLDNTNKLVLDLRPDIEFIKNNLVNGSPEGKDYTEQLNQIIELLKPCVATAEKPCPDDDDIVKKLKEIQDFMEADFVPDTDSTEVEVEDLTDIELDRNLIKFGVAQCPPDNEFSTMVNGFSFSGGFKHKPLCDFFTLLSPFIKAFGGFSAALILGGGLRRG